MVRMNEETTTESTLPETQEERLVTVLYSLESQIQRQNSLKFTLLKGVVYGLGTVIGASVLVALFGGVLASFLSSIVGDSITAETLIEGR